MNRNEAYSQIKRKMCDLLGHKEQFVGGYRVTRCVRCGEEVDDD